jgi:hypothetical protein
VFERESGGIKGSDGTVKQVQGEGKDGQTWITFCGNFRQFSINSFLFPAERTGTLDEAGDVEGLSGETDEIIP